MTSQYPSFILSRDELPSGRGFPHETKFHTTNFRGPPNTASAETLPVQKNPNNPYRRKGRASSDAAATNGFQEPQRPGAVRTKTPIRAVFEDLETAHSSITSRSVKSRHGEFSRHNSELDEGQSIPLQDLEPVPRPTNKDFLQSLPLPPPPTLVFYGRYEQGSNSCLLTSEEVALESSANLASPIVPTMKNQPADLPNVCKALTQMSPITADERTVPRAAHWPRDSLELKIDTKRYGSVRQDMHHGDEGSRPKSSRSRGAGSKCHVDKLNDSPTKILGNDFSIYHSTPGGAPTGSLPSISPEDARTVNNASGGGHIGKTNNGHGHNGATRFLGFQSPSTSAGPPGDLVPVPVDSQAKLSNSSSLPECSTVGNIYKHYVPSGGPNGNSSDDGDVTEKSPVMSSADERNMDQVIADFGLQDSFSSMSSEQLRPSALNVRKQRRAERLMLNPHGRPPQIALPSMPRLDIGRIAPSTSQGLVPSSSYGDTKNLLEITQRTNGTESKPSLSRSDGCNDLRADQDGLQGKESQLNYNNPFSTNFFWRGSSVQEADRNYVYGDLLGDELAMADRQPLEREVSKALRRASGFSAYSNGSIHTSVLEYYGEFQSEISSRGAALSQRLNFEDTPPSASDGFNEEDGEFAAQSQSFYDAGAISPNWIASRRNNVIRIPIHHGGSLPDSPPDSPVDQVEDANDWETVGESAVVPEGRGGRSTSALLTGTINRAGSSLANVSDESSESPHLPEVDELSSSTERIAQHPGNIQYFGDYRQRDLKKTRIPVFLPVFREHKVNGYLADSNRLRPRENLLAYNSPPPPLGSSHTNPFKSPPPEIKTLREPTVSDGNAKALHARRPARFQLSEDTRKSSIETDIADATKIPTPVTRTSDLMRPSSPSSDWMDDFGDPGPMISNQHREQSIDFDNPGRPSSRQDVNVPTNRGGVPGYNLDGSRRVRHGAVKASPSTNIGSIGEKNSLGKGDKSVAEKIRSGKRTHTPLAPGAFYQGLRSTSDRKRASWLYEETRTTRTPVRPNSTKDYPTNMLRPLSLLADGRPLTPVGNARRGPSENVHPNDFVYRSPLAPPRRDSWQQLYSKSHLKNIREAAKADGVFDSQVTSPETGINGESSKSVKEGSTRKHLFESPRLFAWTRASSTRTDLAPRRKKVSGLVLCLCNLFPPLLYLFAIGRLDGIMVWLTRGECSTFGKRQKKWAFILMCCWALATFFGLVAFLVYMIVVHDRE